MHAAGGGESCADIEALASQSRLRDPGSAFPTRMLRFDPGTETSGIGVLRHDFGEEIFILTGELHDLTVDKVFPADAYACLPPGMPHAPWRTEPGYTTFEVRYPVM